MKICFCLDSLNCGGVERVVSSLSNYMVKQGNEIYILIVSSNNDKSFYRINENVNIQTLFSPEGKTTKYIKRVKLLKKKFLEMSPDVVFSFIYHISIYCFLALRKTGIKHICCERTDPNSEPKKHMLKLMRDYVFKHSDGCVFQTQGALDYYKGKIKSSVIIPNPLFLNCSTSHNIKRNNVVCCAGRLVEQKDYKTAILAFSSFLKKYPSYEMHIYGSGPLKESLVSLALQLGCKDKVLFFDPTTDWLEIEKNSSMYLLSSIFEGMPNSLMEAMAVGIPSISSDCSPGGPRFLIRNGENGFLFKTHDSDDLFKKMIILASDPSLGTAFSLANKDMSKTFNIELIAKKWIDYSIEIANKKQRR